MIMKQFFPGAIFAFLFMACGNTNTPNNCSIDYEFQANFENCLAIIMLRQLGKPVSFEQISKAYGALQKITEIESKVKTGSDSPYFYQDSTYESLFKDLTIWSKWYENNKCHYSMEDAYNVFSQEKMVIPDYSDSLQIERLSLLYPNLNISEAIQKDSLNRASLRIAFPEFIMANLIRED